MSGVGGEGGGSSRVSIPNNLRKTIQHIKEITACHSEEEIYAMLKECSMDPNETAQKLLFQDTFHVVKRRRDRKKENPPPKETPEPRRQLGPQGRASRAGRSNYLPQNFRNDAGDGRDSGTEKENGSIPGTGTSATSDEMTNKETPAIASSAIVTTETISGIVDAPNVSAVSPVKSSEMVSSSATPASQRSGTGKNFLGCENSSPQPTSTSANSFYKETTSSSVCFSSSDPVIVPSCDARPPNVVGIIKRQVGANQFTSEPEPVNKIRISGAPEVGSSLDHEKMPIKVPEGENSRSAQIDHHSSTSSQGLSTGSRPQSNYSSRSLHLPGSQKVTQNKEWKPKPSNQNVHLRSETIPSAVNLAVRSEEISSTPAIEEAKLRKKMEGLNLPHRQPVILPRHIHIPESEKINFSFGSFDASFSAIKLSKTDPEDDDKSTVATEISHGAGGAIKQSASLVVEASKVDEPQVNPQSQMHRTEIVTPCEVDSSSNTALEQRDIKQEDAIISGSHSHSVIHTSPNYNFGIVPQMIGGLIAPVENSEPQERDTDRLPSFVVPQPLDPASYYGQIYRSSLDGDGRLSPFSSHEITPKYNDYAAVLPQQSSQPTQEGGNPSVLSTSGPTPLVTQAAGLMQSSIAMSQPPLSVFRPPPGVHLSPYHQNYIPYGHYFPPFYVHPPTIPQYIPNGAFPQQPHGSGLFAAPPSAAAQGIKYPLPQYRTSTTGSTTNAAHVGMPIGYGQYDATAHYNSSSAGTTGNTTSADDLNVSKFRESNMYVGGQQQNEGSRMWVATPGRDMTSLATTSFYNIPNSGSATNVYHHQQHHHQQQQQHSQITWPNNY